MFDLAQLKTKEDKHCQSRIIIPGHDPGADFRGPGEADFANQWMIGDRLADFRTRSGDDVDHARGDPGANRQFREFQRGQWGDLKSDSNCS